jgi:hypothetical protein
MSNSNTSENNIINKISKNLLNKLDPSIANDVIKKLPKQLYLSLKKSNLLKEQEEILSEGYYKSDSLETNPDYISSTNLPYNIPVPIAVHENNLYQDNMQPKYRPGSYRPPQIISTGIEGFDEEDNTKQDVPIPESSTQQSDTQSSFEKQAPKKPASQQSAPQQSAPQQSAPQQSAPQQSAPQQSAPQQPISQQSAIPFTSLPLNIFSLDLRQLISFSLKATGDTFNDIYKLYSTNSPITLMSIISILLTDNRILYLGISFLLIAIVMYIFNNFIRLPSLFGVGGSDKKVYINNY